MAYYVLNDNKCLFESLTKEQILAAITQAITTHTITDVDTGFVTKLKEKNKNAPLSFWVGTTAEYNALLPKPQNTFCILTDDTDGEEIEEAIEFIESQLQTINNNLALINGKNGQVLIDDTIGAGSVSVEFGGNIPIDEFSVVSVDNVLCKVVPASGGVSASIKGTGSQFNSDQSQSVLTIIDIDLQVDFSTNKLTNNKSREINITILQSGAINSFSRTISSIIGVC